MQAISLHTIPSIRWCIAYSSKNGCTHLLLFSIVCLPCLSLSLGVCVCLCHFLFRSHTECHTMYLLYIVFLVVVVTTVHVELYSLNILFYVIATVQGNQPRVRALSLFLDIIILGIVRLFFLWWLLYLFMLCISSSMAIVAVLFPLDWCRCHSNANDLATATVALQLTRRIHFSSSCSSSIVFYSQVEKPLTHACIAFAFNSLHSTCKPHLRTPKILV